MTEFPNHHDRDTCPACGASMQAEPIPEEHRHHYGDKTHYSRVIGVEVPGVYDGILYWLCPDCGHKWHRWPEGHPLRARAERYVIDQSYRGAS